MSLLLIVGITAATLLLALFIQWKRKYNKLPPGPQRLPIIGNFHQIGDSTMAVDITRLGKTYGDIFTVHFLMTPVLVINSFKVIKELIGSQEYSEIFSGRVSSYFSKHLLPGDMFFQTVTDGQQYMRGLVMRGVKQYGTALRRVEHIAQEELRGLVERTREKNGLSVDPMADIARYMTNIIMVLVCGESFDSDHQIMQTTREIVSDFEYLYNFKSQILMDVVPFSTSVPSTLRDVCRRFVENTQLFTDAIAKMRKDETMNRPDCLFALLESEHKAGRITLNNVKGIILDMVIAGVITSMPTLYCTLLAMAHFPEVQKKIQEEIQRVVGDDRLPGLDDKANLPYSNATLLEIFRYFSPIPLAGPRNTIRDCKFRGYFIPKDTMSTYNVWQVHHDEEFWEEPFTFDPFRFLDCEGNLLPPENERRQRLMTFGIGKRSCIGEVLARVRTFLAVTAILQNFDVKEDPTFPLPSSDPRTYYVKLITMPPPYKVRFVPRTHKS